MADHPPLTGHDADTTGRCDERRLVTVLFADLAGFTGLAEHRDPEEVQDLLNSCFDALVPCVERYEGTIDKFMGDAMMVVFGAPVAHENDAERAIRTALDIRTALAAVNREHGLELAVHQGISSGLVMAGSIGGGQRRDYSVVGDTVNLASRLEELSAPDEILIGPDTYALAGFLFETEEAGPVSVRGRTEAIQVRRVSGEARTDTVRALSRLRAPMVGREKELGVFLEALQRLQGGQGSVLYVCGEAGLGKSRLIAEANKAGGPGILWLEGQAISVGQNVSYRLFKQMIETDAGCAPDDDDAERLAKIECRVARLWPMPSSHELAFLAALLGVATAEHTDWLTSFDESVFPERFHAVITAYFGGLARQRPLVLVFEDLHWVDASSAAAIETLLPLATSAPILICLVSRPDLDASFFGPQRMAAVAGERFGDIRLIPLARAETRELVAHLLASAQLPTGLYQLVERRAEGNPFFVQEILLSLITSGHLVEDGEGGWRLRSRSGLAVPDTLQGMIASRIDQLPPQARQTIRIASVVGRSFTLPVVSEVMGLSREKIATQLAQLEDLEMIRTLTNCSEPEFGFSHALVQEAAYETIPLRERRLLHEKVAGALESLPEDFDERADAVAYHYSRAERWDRAQEHLFKAGQEARLLGQQEASQYYRQALEAILLGWRGQSADEYAAASLDWFESSVVPLVHQARLPSIYEPLRDFHNRITEAFGPHDRRSLVAAEMLGYAYAQKWMLPECISILEATLRSREALDGPDDPSLALMMSWLASAYVNTGRNEEAEKILVRGIELQRSSGVADVDTLATLYTTLSYCRGSQGRVSEQRAFLEDALAVPGLDTSPLYCGLLANLCDCEVQSGLNAEAELHGRLGSENGVILVRTICRTNLGYALRTSGRYREALRELEQALDAFENLENDENVAWVLAEIAECRLQLRELDAAADSALRAANLVKPETDGGQAGVLGQALWTLAGIELARGDLIEAELLLSKAGPLVGSDHAYGSQFWEAEMLYRRAQVNLKKGHRDEAERYMTRAVGLLEELGGTRHARRKTMLAEWEGLAAEA